MIVEFWDQRCPPVTYKYGWRSDEVKELLDSYYGNSLCEFLQKNIDMVVKGNGPIKQHISGEQYSTLKNLFKEEK